MSNLRFSAPEAEDDRLARVDRFFAKLLADSMLWMPVLLAAGIALYFALKVEPALPLSVWVFGLGAGLWLRARSQRPASRALWSGLLIIGLGLGAGTLRTTLVAAPVLADPFTGAVEGRFVSKDLSASGRTRVLLDRVVLHGLPQAQTPERVRVVLAKKDRLAAFGAGERVLIYARLSAPGPPVEVGGFDFRRYAWFRQLGAVGFATGPVMPALSAPQYDAFTHVQRLRNRLSDHLRAQIPGDGGAFAAAILVGDRSSLNDAKLEDLRASNLAHLLAISGLHMGLVTGIVFAFVRFGLALWPAFADRHPAKSYAAAAAIAAGALYLAFSGASIATQRAFVMAAIAFGAVMIGRPALTLRAVALAATIILLYRPESLMEPGFQMSFAATTALVYVFGRLSAQPWWATPRSGAQRLRRWVAALVVSSATAGLATAPFGAFHFNQVAQYGLLANLLAVPIMGSIVMPALLLGLLLSPVFLAAGPMMIAGHGISAILWVASWVASMDGALRLVPKGPTGVLGLIALGAIILILVPGRARFAGPCVVGLGLLLWANASRPLVLVDPKGALVGVMTNGQRALNKARGSGLAATVWLENDGDPRSQKEAAGASAFGWQVGAPFVIGVTGADAAIKTTSGPGARACLAGEFLFALKDGFTGRIDPSCTVVDPPFVAKHGAVALRQTKNGLALQASSDHSGQRPWTGAQNRAHSQR